MSNGAEGIIDEFYENRKKLKVDKEAATLEGNVFSIQEETGIELAAIVQVMMDNNIQFVEMDCDTVKFNNVDVKMMYNRDTDKVSVELIRKEDV